jgi:flavin reductase (DIM6/NTAB) family NADH-FMN oxidoreductase RutF
MINCSALLSKNLLAQHLSGVALTFSRSAADAESKFTAGSWTSGAHGMSLLADAVAAPECCVHRRIEEGADAIMIGRVLDAIAGPGAIPLLHSEGNYTRPDPSRVGR